MIIIPKLRRLTCVLLIPLGQDSSSHINACDLLLTRCSRTSILQELIGSGKSLAPPLLDLLNQNMHFDQMVSDLYAY